MPVELVLNAVTFIGEWLGTETNEGHKNKDRVDMKASRENSHQTGNCSRENLNFKIPLKKSSLAQALFDQNS